LRSHRLGARIQPRYGLFHLGSVLADQIGRDLGPDRCLPEIDLGASNFIFVRVTPASRCASGRRPARREAEGRRLTASLLGHRQVAHRDESPLGEEEEGRERELTNKWASPDTRGRSDGVRSTQTVTIFGSVWVTRRQLRHLRRAIGSSFFQTRLKKTKMDSSYLFRSDCWRCLNHL
jgi:hypothetical protein